MFTILAELFSTIGMVLLAGEYLQGRSGWFNRFLECYILRVAPIQFYVRNYSFRSHPLIVAKQMIKRPRSFITYSLVPAICLLIGGVWFTELATQVPLSDETDAALASSDPVVRERARQALLALAQSGVECLPMVEHMQSIQDNKKRSEAADAAVACFEKWQPQMQLHYLNLLQRVVVLICINPYDILYICYFFVFISLLMSYFVSVALSISMLYTRMTRIDSFILPIGFLFTAVGQIIKLVTVII